jgi:ferredoxin
MAHQRKSGYTALVDRLNRFPQGAPASETLYQILKMLFSEKEATIVSQLPVRPFTAEKAARILKTELKNTQHMLDELASRAILLDMEQNGTTIYVLPPPMAGFFEFSMMRIRKDLNQKVLSELFYQYLNVEDEFIRQLFANGETQLGRTFVHEPALSDENALHVLDYERASHVIQTASHIGIGLCYCRHKMQHLNRACDAPMDICMTFNTTAASLIKHGHAREVDVKEGLDLLDQAYEHNLVQFGENVREQVNFICNCCGCCCEAMIAARRFAVMFPIHTTNFLPAIRTEICIGCGKCLDICPVNALSLISAQQHNNPRKKVIQLDEDRCLGCGLCVRRCPQNCVRLKSRSRRILTPVNGVHRVVMMAIERGKLEQLIIDNQVVTRYRALAAVLGVILKLPPVKQALACRQFKSRYLEALIRRF